MDSILQKAKALLGKIKGNKKAEFFIALVIVVIVVAIFFARSGIFSIKTSEKNDSVVVKENADTIERLEERLAKIISGIKGVGDTDVLITVAGTNEKVTEKSTTSSVTTSSNGGGNTSSTNVTTAPIIVNNGGKSEPYVVKETYPEILGVIVVAKGAESNVIKVAILRAVQTALRVDSSRVEIYPMN